MSRASTIALRLVRLPTFNKPGRDCLSISTALIVRSEQTSPVLPTPVVLKIRILTVGIE